VSVCSSLIKVLGIKLIYSYTHILIYSYTHILIYSYTHILIYSYTHILIYSYTHALIYSYIHILAIIYSYTQYSPASASPFSHAHALIYSYSLTHSLTHSLIYSYSILVSGCVSIRSLSLRRCNITDKALAYISQHLSDLRELDISYCGI